MIITIYHQDGRKERRPVGYAGAQCHQATAPYEAMEIPGQMTKTPTADAARTPATQTTQTTTQERLKQ